MLHKHCMDERTDRPEPDHENCRTLYLGRLINLYECVSGYTDECRFVRQFEGVLICGHPDCSKFQADRGQQ
jgi:hypothetical protein